MTLKQKSIFVSLTTTIAFLIIVVAVVYWFVTVQFQQVENQRVERNIRRIQAIIDDRFVQMNAKLVDWALWDDTYFYLQDNNKKYEESNLIPESFGNIDIDEVLFIDKKGALVNSVLVNQNPDEELNFPDDLYLNFASGSALAKVDNKQKYNHGLIKTDDGLLMYVLRDVYRSDASGESGGKLVFARYLDVKILNSVKELTQFEAKIYLWNDPLIPSDYLTIKENYLQKNNQDLIKILDKNIISGYLVIEDVFGKPQAIIRGDIERDIAKQGLSAITLLAALLVSLGIILSGLNYYLLTVIVLRKVTLIANDVYNLGKTDSPLKRLEVGKTADEIDTLRAEINNMIDSLRTEKQMGKSLVDLVNAFIINIGSDGKIITINQKGADLLGYPKEEIIGQDWVKTFIPESARPTVSQVFNDLVSGKIEGNAHLENEILTKDKSIILISWHNTTIKDNSGKVVSTLSLGEDITKEKEETSKKEAYSNDLEKLNATMVNRELKMIELKKEIGRLSKNNKV